MALYEHVFLCRQDVTVQQVEMLSEQFRTIVEGQGGKVDKVEYWGVKSLQYRIKKNKKAHMTLMNVTAPAAAINEIERQESISEDVIRFMTVRVDAHEEGPSAMLRKVERDERRDDDRYGGYGSYSPPRGDRGASMEG